jgi:drug/metabolite transporter (DMT)-like permease
MQRTLITVALIVFGTLTVIALWQHGYWGIILRNFENTASMQVFADLVIALALILVWMWRDAKASGRNIWPWIAVTLVAGSFGPLCYLLTKRSANQ